MREYTVDDVIRIISTFIDERADANRKVLNEALAGKLTDTGKDRSEYLKGVSGALASVKFFIEKGLRDV